MVGFGTRAQAPLSLGDALRLTEESNPKLTAARAQIDGASAGIMTAQQIANPELDTLSGSNRARTAGIGSGNFTSIGVSQLIELPAVRSSRIGAAQAGREANAAALAELRLELRAAVKQAYFEVLQRKGEVSLALETEALLTQIRNRIDARVRIGEAARFELTRADAELARARTVSATARLRVLQALSTLRTTIGVPIAENSQTFSSWRYKNPEIDPALDAMEAMILDARQSTELKLQAIRIGDLTISTFPNEVYAITGLKLRAQSPSKNHFNIELANGAEGYIPPPEQHLLGGYTTWPARTAGLAMPAARCPAMLHGSCAKLHQCGFAAQCTGCHRRAVVLPAPNIVPR